MNFTKYFFILLVTTFVILSCKTKQNINSVSLSPTQKIVFLDSLKATMAIVKDDKESFFNHIGILDMSIQMKAENGAICTLSLSFNNDGPLGTFFRYICDNDTYIARYDDLVNGKEEPIDVSNIAVSMNGIELEDREFFAAIKEGREPNASVHQVLPCMQVLDLLEQKLKA